MFPYQGHTILPNSWQGRGPSFLNLNEVTKEEYQTGSWRRDKKYQILGVRYTTLYEKGKLGNQIFVHRDVNAASNIADIYIFSCSDREDIR